ncbi:hypothetical protein [Citreimonas salinaria]|uniref:Flp pilus assembly protein, ATPase CpaE n=1 Tax=Citreimonas salinaria TaxID=321339 RepID=A0A1H3LYV5_9RHOB|nr:hypothetical protein [Citreimonas salinaria]SDY69590.1 Flp pilus assembly protein, ATPase CpaE [Citreimonas salinaria]
MAQTVNIYSPDEDVRNNTRTISGSLGLVCKTAEGGVDALIEDMNEWVMPPHILVIDMSASDDVPADLERIAAAGPSAEISTIAIGDVEDLRLARRLRKLGVDYVCKPLEREDLVDALTAAMASTDPEKATVDASKITTVTGTEGGTGVSTIAAAIASRKAESGRVLLLDLDFICGTQYVLHGGLKTEGFCSAIQVPARLDSVSLERLVNRTGNPNLYLLSDPGLLRSPPDPGGLSGFLSLCARAFDHVVIDLPRHCEWGSVVLPLSGSVVVATRPSFAGAVQLAEFVEAKGAGLVDDALVVVVNDSNGAKSESIEKSAFSERTTAPIIYLPHDPVSLYREVLDGEMRLQTGAFSKHFRKLVAVTAGKAEEESKSGGGLFSWLNS